MEKYLTYNSEKFERLFIFFFKNNIEFHFESFTECKCCTFYCDKETKNRIVKKFSISVY